jgi:mycofactocin precursor
LSQSAKLSRAIAGGERRVAWPDRREERRIAMSTAPEQLEETPVEPEPEEAPVETEELVVEDLLVEDVSIDGMCGVY